MKAKFTPALLGLKAAFSDFSVIILVIIAILALIGAWLLNFTFYEFLIVLMMSALVIGLEIVNSAIEILADLVDNNNNSKIAQVKDLSAAAVFWAALMAFLVGILIVIKHLI